MKKLFLFLTLSSLVFSSAADAVEYVVLKTNGTNSINLKPTDVVEIVGHKPISNMNQFAILNFEGWGALNLSPVVTDKNNNELGVSSVINGTIITGATKATLSGSNFGPVITLKITHASEINKAGPSTVLVLPENATGNYNLVVESSTDSINWIPFHSGTVNSDTAERLFRVRIVHKGQEEAKAKAEEKK